jgi:hypothetical protein
MARQTFADLSQDKWFKGWPNIDVCLGEQRGTGPGMFLLLCYMSFGGAACVMIFCVGD